MRVLEREPENVRRCSRAPTPTPYWRKDPEQALADASSRARAGPRCDRGVRSRASSRCCSSTTSRRRARRSPSSGAGSRRPIRPRARARGTAPRRRSSPRRAASSTRRASAGTVVSRSPSRLVRRGRPARSSSTTGTARAERARSRCCARRSPRQPDTYVFRTLLADRLLRAGRGRRGRRAAARGRRERASPQAAAAIWLDARPLSPQRGRSGLAPRRRWRARSSWRRSSGRVPPQYPFEYAEALVLVEAVRSRARGRGRAHRARAPAPDPRARGAGARRSGARARGVQRSVPAVARQSLGALLRGARGRRRGRLRPRARGVSLVDPDRPGRHRRAHARRRAADRGGQAAFRVAAAARDGRRSAGDRRDSCWRCARSPSSAAPKSCAPRSERFPQACPVLPALALAEIARGHRGGERWARRSAATAARCEGGRLHGSHLRAGAARARARRARGGRRASRRAELAAALAAHPDAAVFQEIHGLDLELSGAVEPARAAYSAGARARARERARAGGLGPPAAREPTRRGARLLRPCGRRGPGRPRPGSCSRRRRSPPRESATRRRSAWTRCSTRIRCEVEAAMLRATLDLDRGTATERTLERARRAVRLGGGIDALELLSRVHAQARRVREGGAGRRARPRPAREAGVGVGGVGVAG